MAWQSDDRADLESDVTRKLTDENDFCNTKIEDNSDNQIDSNDSLEENLSDEDSLNDDFSDEEVLEGEALEDDSDEEDLEWETMFLMGLRKYDEDKVQEFLNEEIDDDLMPLVFGTKAQQELIEALAESIGVEAATRVVKKQVHRQKRERARWKRERICKRYNKVIKGMSVAAAAIVVFIGVGYFGGQVGAWSLPEIRFTTIDRDSNSKVVLESSSDIVRTEIEQVYELGIVLDGFELEDSVVDQQMSYFFFVNKSGETYTFMQKTESLGVSLNTGYQKEETLETLYGETIWGTYNGVHCLIWNYQGYTFIIEGKMPQEQFLELQNHLKIKD